MDLNTQSQPTDQNPNPNSAPQAPPPDNPPMPSTPPPPAPPPVTPAPAPPPPATNNNIPLQQPSEQNVGVGTPNIGVEEKQVPRPANLDTESKIEVADYNKTPATLPSQTPADNAQQVQVKNYQSPPQQDQPQPPVKAAGSNTSLVVFIVLALILGSAGGFFGFRYWDKFKTSASIQTSPAVSESPNPDTNTWQTYTSALYKFSVKYPTGWAISSTSDQAESIVFASNEASLEDPPTGFRIEINFQNSNNQTLKKWVEANTAAMGEKNQAKEITVSEQTAYQQELTKTGPKVATYIERPSKIMIITYSAPEDVFSEGGDWYNCLINSIELIK